MPPKKNVMTALRRSPSGSAVIEVLFERVAQGEASDQTHNPCSQADKIAEQVWWRWHTGWWVMAMTTPHELPELSTISTVAMM